MIQFTVRWKCAVIMGVCSRMFARFERNGMSVRISIKKKKHVILYITGTQNVYCAQSEKTC